MQFAPAPNQPGRVTILNDGSVPYAMTASWSPQRVGLPANTPPAPPGSPGWFPLLYLQQNEPLMAARQLATLQQQAQAAQFAAFRAASVALYDVTFSVQITAGDDLSLVSWQWTAVWFGGGRLYAPEGLVRTDGSEIDPTTGYVGGTVVEDPGEFSRMARSTIPHI